MRRATNKHYEAIGVFPIMLFSRIDCEYYNVVVDNTNRINPMIKAVALNDH